MSALVAEACARALTEACADVLSAAADGPCGVILSGGVDTGAVLAACARARSANPSLPRIKYAVTVAVGTDEADSRDAVFSRRAARAFAAPEPMEHAVVVVSPETLVREGLDDLIRAIRLFDPMQVRNALVVDRALREMQSRFPDCRLWLSGDAADELLGGYSFTWSLSSEEWKLQREKMVRDWYFSTDDAAAHRSLRVLSPFRQASFLAWAMTLRKEDCVGEDWIVIRPEDPPVLHATGKLCLRRGFPENPSCNRRKEPVQSGSGSEVLSRPGFFEGWGDAGAALAPELGVRLDPANREQHVYFESFARVCRDALLPKERRAGKDPTMPCCIKCGFALSARTADYCRTCGTWPAVKLTE